MPFVLKEHRLTAVPAQSHTSPLPKIACARFDTLIWRDGLARARRPDAAGPRPLACTGDTVSLAARALNGLRVDGRGVHTLKGGTD